MDTKRADMHMQGIIKAIIIILVFIVLIKIFILPGGLLNRSGDNAIESATQTQIEDNKGGQLPSSGDQASQKIVKDLAKIFNEPSNRPCIARFTPATADKELTLNILQNTQGGIDVYLKKNQQILADTKIPGPMSLCALHEGNGPLGFIEKYLQGQKEVLGFVRYETQLDIKPTSLSSFFQGTGLPFFTQVTVGNKKFEWWSKDNLYYVFYPSAEDHLFTDTPQQKGHAVCILPMGYVEHGLVDKLKSTFSSPAPPVCGLYEGGISSDCAPQMDTFVKEHECQFKSTEQSK